MGRNELATQLPEDVNSIGGNALAPGVEGNTIDAEQIQYSKNVRFPRVVAEKRSKMAQGADDWRCRGIRNGTGARNKKGKKAGARTHGTSYRKAGEPRENR